jgi:release factor glutamine methyltransferase
MYDKSNITTWLASATKQLLDAGIASARLDAELILSHTIRKGRTYLHAHPDEELSDRHHEIANARLLLRLDRTPLAYIIGHKEFYGRRFQVTPATLIPRPESETMITLLKNALSQPKLSLSSEKLRLVDVGTGSGCLGITAKLEFPELDITLLDNSRHALTVAEDNARRLQAEVTIIKSNLLSDYPFEADFILANLPYVGSSWEVSPETRHEPKEALYADDNGLALIKQLIAETPRHLAPGGSLFIEADPRQHEAVIAEAKRNELGLRTTKDFIIWFERA